MQLPLSNQIAFTLRYRPLVLPMLLATACVDLVMVWQQSRGGDPVASSLLFHFVMLAQTGLLALWTASNSSLWWLKLGVSFAAIVCFSMEPGWVLPADTLGTHCVYYASVLAIEAALRTVAYFRASAAGGLRFQTRHLLIAMTVTGVLGASLKLFQANRWSRVDDLYFIIALHSALVAMPFLCRAIVRRTRRSFRSNALAGIYCLMAAVVVGGAPSLVVGGSINELFVNAFVNVAVVLAAWFIAVDVRPDARRRLAARRERRRAKPPELTVVPPP
ncbi:hypothetical protein Pla123a_06160 [Posidoniimonas polymericola]|uniref:Uncharacterized protein n=1 Tax=Posidoniimonas polymericola TaxID=2528002 RepID=A0A5C5ZEE9_9BACT|nr:hypothetical protein [Posidoniimonas polymericola]TWT85809.1 hypothetical protein Pla123a_06160 [Posidoniimonas polymericola]